MVVRGPDEKELILFKQSRSTITKSLVRVFRFGSVYKILFYVLAILRSCLSTVHSVFSYLRPFYYSISLLNSVVYIQAFLIGVFYYLPVYVQFLNLQSHHRLIIYHQGCYPNLRNTYS